MRAALSVALALLLAACSEATGPGRDLRVETSQSVYTLPGGPGAAAADVQFTVRNNGSTTVALPRCGDVVIPALQRLEAGTWVTVNAGFCPSFALQLPLELAPGEVAQGRTTVSEAGQYRLLVPVAEEIGAEFASRAVSPSFLARSLEN